MILSYDRTLLARPSDGDYSLLTDAVARFQEAKPNLGFTKLPYADVSDIQQLADAVRGECENLVVIGIGGSDLGARAVHRALNHQFYNLLPSDRRSGPRLFFVGDTTDPVALTEVLEIIDLHKTVVVVISKSGNTIEQMSTFVYLREQLINVVGEDRSRQQIVILTDPESGTLREIAQREGYRGLGISNDVGGRFSVLSSVGLFPLAVVGVDIQSLIEGARYVAEQNQADSPAALFALDQYLAAQNGQPISVLMPY